MKTLHLGVEDDHFVRVNSTLFCEWPFMRCYWLLHRMLALYLGSNIWVSLIGFSFSRPFIICFPKETTYMGNACQWMGIMLFTQKDGWHALALLYYLSFT